MPSQPAWFHRLPEILEHLRAFESSHLDRLAVEKLFGVGERRARQIMAGLPGIQVGNAFGVERQALLARLESIAAGDRFRCETSRRAKLAEELERTRRELAGRRVRIPSAADARDRRLGELSADIVLHSDELRIHFCGAEDLAAKLFELSQAIANDWISFSRAVEEDASLPRGTVSTR